MPKTITSTELQKNTRELIEWTRARGEPIIVESDGKPVAAILSYAEFQANDQVREARTARFTQLQAAAGANAAANGLTEIEAMVLVDAERQMMFDERLSTS